VYDRALALLAAVVYWRPDLVRAETVACLGTLLSCAPLPEALLRRSGELLRFLLATPAAPHGVSLLIDMLSRPGRSHVEYSVLLDGLDYAACWAMPHLNFPDLVTLLDNPDLGSERERLLHGALERAMFARPEALTVPHLEGLVGHYAGNPSLKHVLYYLSCGAGLAPDVRERASQMLIVQNIADRQGDEIIRLVPLLESMLQFNPRLEVVLVTNREYLYGHSRVRLVPIDDRRALRSVFRRSFEVIIDFYESVVPEANYNRELEQQVQGYVRTHSPFVYITSRKGWNTFVYQRVDVQTRAYAIALGLDKQRVASVYETTFRLIAELGLPLRLGEESPGSDSTLAGLPCPEAQAAWAKLVQENTEGRRIALLCPFGGAEPLKGYTERNISGLVDEIRRLILEGFYVVMLPNGTPWASEALAREVVGYLKRDEQQQVAVAPDPAAGRGTVTYERGGKHTIPVASYQMRLVTYFVRFADLVVSVEGWMVHAAYCLGKRYRVLMLPYSHPSEWHPYGRTLMQDVNVSAREPVPATEDATGGPAPGQPRKFVLLYLLKSLGRTSDPRAVPLLRWALRSDDRDVRREAALALSRFGGEEVEAVLQGLLADPANRVRGAAADALLERVADPARGQGWHSRAQLLAHQAIGRDVPDWSAVLRLGDGARAALAVALQDDDTVIRREAASVVQMLDRHASTSRSATASGIKRSFFGLISPNNDVGHWMAVMRRRLSRRTPATGSDGSGQPLVLVLTPVKDAADCLDAYCERLFGLTYPHRSISIGFLESDSSDTTLADLQRRLPALRVAFRRAGLWKKDFGYRIPAGLPRWDPTIQVERRSILAKSRNHLLFRALEDEAWVLWLDVDVVQFPSDLIEKLLATGKDIVQPHCVLEPRGRTFDLNAWRDHGRLHLDDLRVEGELVELDAVGGTVLLVRADVHREGLTFPTFLYGRTNPRSRTGARGHFMGPLEGEIETEGLGIMAHDMGYGCWGMPHFEVIHRKS
jgi:peptide chain release factor subunit 1